MAGIIFTHAPSRQKSIANARLNRRLLVAGSAAFATTLALGAPAFAQTPDAGPVATPGASPVVTGVGGKLASLLELIPAFQGGAAQGVLFYYADLETQLKALGIAQDGTPKGADLFTAAAPLALASQAFQFGLLPEFSEAFGFSPFDTHRSLYTGSPPADVSLFQGGLDRERLVSAWKKSGYAQKKTDEGMDFWTIGEEGKIDVSTATGRMGVGAFNNAVILDDGTLVFARFATVIKGIAKQSVNGGTSLADQPGISQAITTLSDRMVSAIGVAGSFASVSDALRSVQKNGKSPTTSVFAESDDAVGKMPRVDVMVFAVEAGVRTARSDGDATPEATVTNSSPQASPVAGGDSAPLVEARLHTASAKDAAQAAKVVAWRWDHMDSLITGAPYRSLMKRVSAEVANGDETVAAIDFDPGLAGGRWLQMINGRDLLPFEYAD